MTFKRYLSIDQAIAYLSENQPFNSELKDLQELERFGQIKPLIYLTDVMFSKNITFNDFDGDQILRGEVSAVSGYFKPSDFIFLDRYTLNPYREFQDEYFELKLFDSLEIEHLTSSSDKLSKGDKGTISGVKGFSDQLVTEIPCELVFISRIELDALLSSEIKEDDKTINELNQRIKQLEQQLEQQQLAQPDIGLTYTTPAIEVMNAVINEHWLNYNPNKPAPKQSSVTKWITDNYKDISKALALNIDKVCRHPDAKAGGQFKK